MTVTLQDYSKYYWFYYITCYLPPNHYIMYLILILGLTKTRHWIFVFLIISIFSLSHHQFAYRFSYHWYCLVIWYISYYVNNPAYLNDTRSTNQQFKEPFLLRMLLLLFSMPCLYVKKKIYIYIYNK